MSEATAATTSSEDVIRRVLDVSLAGFGLVLTSPVLLLGALAVKLSSPGPVLFHQERVGLHGRSFEILKLRTMVVGSESVGGQLTIGADPRVTRVGRFLRAWKIDELPQLINVLRGDMALVGPRPEVPRYVALYSPEQRDVLSVRPGITDPASIRFRNESEHMALQADPEAYYREVLLPNKLRLNLDYIARRSILGDLGILLATARAVIIGRGS